MLSADVLEHADRDDAVKGAGLLAVIAQVEAHAACEARLFGAPCRDLVLFLRQGHAGPVAAADLGEV